PSWLAGRDRPLPLPFRSGKICYQQWTRPGFSCSPWPHFWTLHLSHEVNLMPSRPLRTFTVLPHLPARLQGLQQLAYNLWWCWNHEAVSLFRRIDEDLFL